MVILKEEPKFSLALPRFIRRKDLSASDRFEIALKTLLPSKYGAITELCSNYSISTRFAYDLRDRLKQSAPSLFTGEHLGAASIRKSLRYILEHRLICKCAIGPLSEMMKREGMPYSSTGFISEVLKLVGESLPNTYQNQGNIEICVVFASDEVFARMQPILITVDPVSSAILRIELARGRSAEEWKKHWQELEENGCHALFVVCDQGTGLLSANRQIYPDRALQPDTYHAVAHHLGLWVNRLDRAAWGKIKNEYEREIVMKSAKTKGVIKKKRKLYREATKQTLPAIELAEDFKFLYKCIIENLQVFDQKGRLNDSVKARANIQCALDYIKELGSEALKKEAESIEKLLPGLLKFLRRAQPIKEQVRKICPDHSDTLSAAWQAHKNAIKAKSTKRRNRCLKIESEHLDNLKFHLGEQYKSVKKEAYRALDNIIQASSMVETINSIIRPYLNTCKNQISQALLNLIMFYHNHRRYRAGKRKAQTPMELLRGKHQTSDWLDLLMEHIEEKLPNLLPQLA